MLGLIVLFTVFLGLVGILFLSQKWQRRAAALGSHDPAENLRTLEAWLAAVGRQLPSAEEVTAVLSHIAAVHVEPVHEEWGNLKVKGLLPRTELPQFSIAQATTSEQQDCIQMVVDVEWPMCVPGVGVAVTLGTGQKVTCHLQVDWMYAQLNVTFAQSSSGGLLLSLKHSQEPKMALSCLVVSPEVKNPESLASSVADALHHVFHDLQLTRQPLGGERLTPNHGTIDTQDPVPPPHPVVPTVLVSAPEEEEEEGEGQGHGKEAELGDGADKVDRDTEASAVVGHSEPEDRANTFSAVEQKPPSKPVVSDLVLCDPTPSSTVPESEVQKEESTPSTTATQETQEEPCISQSPPWRRTPSYEQLQQISLLSSEADSRLSPGLPPEGGLIHRRALTLSMAGSEGLGDDTSYGHSAFPSTLVFEVIDSTRVRHIVALSPAHASKLRRRISHAKKLHIYNDHTFKATRFKERPLCAVCKVKVLGRFGKQGYACRDCGLTVHKGCHCKVDSQCPNSQVTSMNLIYPDSVSTLSSV